MNFWQRITAHFSGRLKLMTDRVIVSLPIDNLVGAEALWVHQKIDNRNNEKYFVLEVRNIQGFSHSPSVFLSKSNLDDLIYKLDLVKDMAD